ncbi:SPOR domain-containing protein [Denitromonas iodatirespirans]|uniref:SPOR domain-containing protein n=1 Tax=Denitromonas iodatirespirans TaxID=2795389 RepID=A0A944H9F7_DENI1|nr:SPOR domain-containing protein [Denitromonas iodatirespirans]MBT0963189.1 SPOR domain-containing protein [Denitromonas iodatirespirans]
MSGNRRTSKKAPARRSGGGVFVGIIIGLMLGAVFAAGVAWYLTRSNPFADQTVPAPTEMPGPQAPRVLPGKPGDRPVEKPQFDFYKILPKGDGAADVPTTVAPVEAPTPVAERFYLQVGAFEDPTEADNLKARLALMGVEASVQRGESANKGTVHRVRLGPYNRVEDMNAVRAELARAGMESSLVRVKP